MWRIRSAIIACTFVCAAGAMEPASAQASAQSGTITSYITGWSADQVKVETTAPFVNPAGCPDMDGYTTSPSDPGNHAHQAALLAAFVSGIPVVIWVSNTTCYAGRPEIIGVGMGNT